MKLFLKTAFLLFLIITFQKESFAGPRFQATAGFPFYFSLPVSAPSATPAIGSDFINMFGDIFQRMNFRLSVQLPVTDGFLVTLVTDATWQYDIDFGRTPTSVGFGAGMVGLGTMVFFPGSKFYVEAAAGLDRIEERTTGGLVLQHNGYAADAGLGVILGGKERKGFLIELAVQGHFTPSRTLQAGIVRFGLVL